MSSVLPEDGDLPQDAERQEIMNTAIGTSNWRTWRSAVVGISQVTAVAAMFLIMAHTLANVVMRTWFNAPLTGTNEYVGSWYLPVTVFVGFVVAQSRREHIEATLLYDRMNKTNKRAFDLLSKALASIVLGSLAYVTFQQALYGYEVRMTTGVTGVPVWPVFFLVPTCFALLSVMYLTDTYRNFRDRSEPQDDVTVQHSPESGQS